MTRTLRNAVAMLAFLAVPALAAQDTITLGMVLEPPNQSDPAPPPAPDARRGGEIAVAQLRAVGIGTEITNMDCQARVRGAEGPASADDGPVQHEAPC